MEGCFTAMGGSKDPERKADRKLLASMKESLESGFYDDNPEHKAIVEGKIKKLEEHLASYDFSKY